MKENLDIVIIGLSITSSWGNGHATTYRALVRHLEQQGHNVLFLERDVPWYAENRDLADPPFGRTVLYDSLDLLKEGYRENVEKADLAMVGSYVPDGVAVGNWVLSTAGGVRAFYDIDTPITLDALGRDSCEYLDRAQIAKYDLYLSFTGGPTLRRLEDEFGSPRARPLYCSVDPQSYFPETSLLRYDLGYMGTYSEDRQPWLENLLMEPSRLMPERDFVVAGPNYPAETVWPENVHRIEHLPPSEHCAFYNSQTFTLNLTRRNMKEAGYAPSVRLFEAAACGVAVISDRWEGLDSFFRPGHEILLAESTEDVAGYLRNVSQPEARAIGDRARQRILTKHTAAHRARELVAYARELSSEKESAVG